MSTKYNLADMLSTIKNCNNVNVGKTVSVPYSNLNVNVLSVMQNSGYIKSCSVVEVRKGVKKIEVQLNFDNKGENILKKFKINSKPSVRIYIDFSDLTKILQKDHYKTYILSTSSGVLNALDAFEKGVGGEFLCSVF